MECPICLCDIDITLPHFKIIIPEEKPLYHEECMKDMISKFGKSLISRDEIFRIDRLQNNEILDENFIFQTVLVEEMQPLIHVQRNVTVDNNILEHLKVLCLYTIFMSCIMTAIVAWMFFDFSIGI